MKFPLSTHREHLKNMRAGYADRLAQLNRQREDVERFARDLQLLETQVETSEKEKRDGFDSEKFLVTRKPF